LRTFNIILISLLATISFGLINFSDSSIVEKEYEKAANEKNFYVSTPSPVTYIDHGIAAASWYGKKFNGKSTANGEIYDESELTAAHKTLPFGTILKVTNTRNNKTVYVRINDRGPFVEGRSLDLSRGSAKALGMTHRGVVKVKIEELAIRAQGKPVFSLD
jgi:rare lipoprotein A